MGEIKIVIPSHNRADVFMTNIKNQIIAVHKSEANDYKDLPFEKIYHNETGLANIRQWIYKKFGDVFMADDDIYRIQRVYTTGKDINLTPEQAYNLIQETYYIAKQVNAFLFGYASSPKPLHYIPQYPLVANGYINASAFGIRKSDKLYFTNKTTAAESHWINLLNAFHHRYNLKDTRYSFRQYPESTFKLKGGQTGIRTIETEKKDTLFLRQKFGNSVLLKKETPDTKISHPYQRKLNIRI